MFKSYFHFPSLPLLFNILLMLITQDLFAQTPTNVTVSTRITASDPSVVDLASTVLMQSKDSTMVKSAVPDRDGVIEFTNVAPGSYLIRVNLVGYQARFSAPFVVDGSTTSVHLPDINLQETSALLPEVTVAAQKPFIERKMDRMIVNVDNSIVNSGSTLLEVLERAPNVLVNQDNGLQLRGKSGVIVMIDGKPTQLSGADLINYLRSIPGANIDRLEIITNPSARYDAAGNAGILDIKFKKDKNLGFNGSATMSYGQGFYGKPSASTNLNYRNKKWNVFGTYSYAHPMGFTRFFINRKFFDENHAVNSVFEQNSFIRQPVNTNFAKLGADYYLSKKTVLGVFFTGNLTGTNRTGNTNSVITNPDGSLQYTTKNFNTLNSRNFNGFVNGNLKHDFDGKGMELTVDIDYGQYGSDNLQHFQSDYFDAEGAPTISSALKTDQEGTIFVKSLKADYVYPVSQQVKIEAGAKSGFVKTDNDIRFYNVVNGEQIPDTQLSNHFIYDENINAAYVNFAREMKKTDVQAGLRMEHTITNGQQITTGETFKRRYLYLFPSAVINQKFSEKYQLSVSYSRRIDRPGYRELNPFRIFVDPYTYVVGDPQLKPVLTNSFELSHTIKGLYVVGMSYSHSKDVITDVFVQDDVTKISNQIPANIQNFDYASVDITIPFHLKKWMNSNFNAGANWNKYTSPFQGGQLNNESYSWTCRINNSFTLGKKGWSAEVNANYQSRLAWGLFVIRDLGYLNAGIQKVTADKKSTFKLSVSDIFYTNRIRVVVQYQNMDFFTKRTWDGRVATVTYTRRFGKNTVAQARRRTSGVEEEKKRAN